MGGDFAEEGAINSSADHATNKRRNPKEPKLSQCPTTNKDCGTGAARWIYGGVRYGYVDQVDEGQSESDCEGRQTLWSTTIGRTQDDQQEERRQHYFSHKARQQTVSPR